MNLKLLREWLREAFTENLLLKLLSLCSAIALFAVTQRPEIVQRTFSVNVVSTMPLDSAKRALTTQLPFDVGVTLRGSRKQLEELHADDLGSVRLDLRSAQDAKIDIDETMFHVPEGLVVEQINPSFVRVKWEDVITKSVPVQVPRTGEPQPGCAVKGVVTSDPPEALAQGPRSALDIIQVARAAPFDVTGLGIGPHTLKLALDRPPSLVSYNVEHITATVEITRPMLSKTLPHLKVEVIGLPRATTRPAAVTIVVTGTADDVNALASDAVVPRVEPRAAGDDLTKPGNDNLAVLVDLPKGMTAQIDPPRVVVTW